MKPYQPGDDDPGYELTLRLSVFAPDPQTAVAVFFDIVTARDGSDYTLTVRREDEKHVAHWNAIVGPEGQILVRETDSPVFREAHPP